MGDFKEHGLMLFLPPNLYLASIQLQAQKKLGRSFAGLYTFNEGAFKLGLITLDEYEFNKARYSKGLDQQTKSLTMEQVNAKKELDAKTKYFSMVLEQWAEHPDSTWRQKKILEAEQWKDRIDRKSVV